MNLILLEADEVAPEGLARLCGARADHALRVLRVAQGDEVRVGVIDGAVGTGRVTAVYDDGVELRCSLTERPERPRVDLILALPRPKVLRRLWSQIAALGVGRIILTNAARVERNYFDTHLLDPAVYRSLLIEGLQQARDTHLPKVSVHRRFRPLVEGELHELCPEGIRLVADPDGRDPLGTIAPPSGGRVLVAVGPEGGWVGFELRLLQTYGFRAVNLGPRTLRSDTACVAVLAVVHAALGRQESDEAGIC